MRPTGKSDDQPWKLDLSSLAQSEFSKPLAPLYEHRRRLLALDGLSLATAELDTGGNRHDRGWIHAWTGNNADFAARDTRSTSASLDQLVAADLLAELEAPARRSAAGNDCRHGAWACQESVRPGRYRMSRAAPCLHGKALAGPPNLSLS